MGDEQIPTIGRCYACKRTFRFTPASVMTAMIDPETGLLPGMTVLGTVREPTPEAVARSVEEPFCPDCVKKAVDFADPPALQFDTWPRGDPDRD
ncbi:hypothetical protein [Nonomuraea sp. NEAU-A123]|uniref:hypothetical protein n=1 Tax=Nonomuraea sp. NEAU-A123 TaxID=2839649 RepID=UPI001BE49BE0|nr:hypothetical protein [Nonomuraea sp. NEAU-A123]MBT2231624.1 hypothetical protein [Nonomuraea sp. NEAU-A123]